MVTRLFYKQKQNIKKNLCSMLPAAMAICAAAMVFTSCSDDDNNDMIGSGDNNTEIKGNYTATTKIKTVTLKEHRNLDYGITIYEDFNYKYDLALYNGKLSLVPYIRVNGGWTLNRDSSPGFSYYYNVSSMKSKYTRNVIRPRTQAMFKVS